MEESFVVPFDITIHFHYKEMGYLIDCEFELHQHDILFDAVEKQLFSKIQNSSTASYTIPSVFKDHVKHSAFELVKLKIQEKRRHLLCKNFFDQLYESYDEVAEEFDFLEEDSSDHDIPTNALSSTSSSSTLFSIKFQQLFSLSPQTQLHMIKIEHQMNIAYLNVLNDQEYQLNQVRNRHLLEMDRLCQLDTEGMEAHETIYQNNSSIASIVQKHAKEMEQLEEEWLQKCTLLKQTLKNQFQKFINDLYETEASSTSKLLQKQQLKLFSEIHLEKPNSSSAQQSLQVIQNYIPKSPSEHNILARTTTNVHLVNQLTNFFMEKVRQQPVQLISNFNKLAIQDLDSEVIQFLKTNYGEIYGFELYLPNETEQQQQSTRDEYYKQEESKRKLNIILINQSSHTNSTTHYFDLFCQEATKQHKDYFTPGSVLGQTYLQSRIQHLKRMFQNQLYALFLNCSTKGDQLTDDPLSCLEWNHTSAFSKLIYEMNERSAPEMLLPDFSTQWKQIRSGLQQSQQEDDNTNRLFFSFVTNHSNLNKIHSLFHFVEPNQLYQYWKRNPSQSSQIMQEYHKQYNLLVRNAFQECEQSGVDSIFVDLPLHRWNPKLTTLRKQQQRSHHHRHFSNTEEQLLLQLEDVMESCLQGLQIPNYRSEEDLILNHALGSVKNVILFGKWPTQAALSSPSEKQQLKSESKRSTSSSVQKTLLF